jgi:hypothetical protein
MTTGHTAFTPAPPACLTLEHSPQGPSACGATEALGWFVRSRLEQDVAAGTVTRRALRILRKSFLQLALALGRRLRQGQPGGLLGPPLPLPFPIAPVLLAAALLPVRRRPIPVGSPPALPVAGLRLAFPATVTAMDMSGREQPLAPLQQAATQPAGRSLKGIIG